MKELRALRKYQGVIAVHILPEIGQDLADVLNREQVRKMVKKAMVPVPRDWVPKIVDMAAMKRRDQCECAAQDDQLGTEEGLLKRQDNPAAVWKRTFPRKSRESACCRWKRRARLGCSGNARYPFGPAYQLIMLTGCRPGEWSKSRRSWIDLKQALAVIPADEYNPGMCMWCPSSRRPWKFWKTFLPIIVETAAIIS